MIKKFNQFDSSISYTMEVFITPAKVDEEEGGMLKIFDTGINNNGVGFTIHSYSEDYDHEIFYSLMGKTVQATIEVVDDIESYYSDKLELGKPYILRAYSYEEQVENPNAFMYEDDGESLILPPAEANSICITFYSNNVDKIHLLEKFINKDFIVILIPR